MKIGVIGFQGDVEEHLGILKRIGEESGNVEPLRVKNRDQLKDVSGIILPGGESTTIFKLIKEYRIYEDIINMVRNGAPLMGTCAGIILSAARTNDARVDGMGLLDIEIERNGYGRQAQSFIDDVEIKGIGNYMAVFIRAPIIKSVNHGEILAYHDGKPVMVRDGNVLGLTFHPELTDDTRIHEYFIGMIGGEGGVSTGTNGEGVIVK